MPRLPSEPNTVTRKTALLIRPLLLMMMVMMMQSIDVGDDGCRSWMLLVVGHFAVGRLDRGLLIPASVNVVGFACCALPQCRRGVRG